MTDANAHKVTDVLPEPTPPPAAGNGERQVPEISTGVSEIVRRWKREDLVKRGCLILHGLALVFSLIAFIVMASNTHGDWKDFDKYEEYRYVLAIGILSSIYTGFQVLRQIQELSTGKESFSRQRLALIGFVGDQVFVRDKILTSDMCLTHTFAAILLLFFGSAYVSTSLDSHVVAYFLLSAASSAVPLTNRMRENNDNIFTDSSVAAISMEFLAFFALAVSALISGHKLSNKSYI